MFDVTVIGNVGIDTNVYFNGTDFKDQVESNFTENIDYIGQAGGYFTRGINRLGYKTAFIGYVGNDYHGKYIREEFNKQGINTRGLFIDPSGTARSINFMQPDGRRKNFYDGKSHMTLRPDMKICRNILSNSRIAHFNIPNWARFLLPVARECGTIISCDIQDIVDPNDSYRKDFIAAADVVFFSSVNFVSPEPVISGIINAYPEKIVVAGMGQAGCAVGIKNHVEYFSAIQINTPVIDTNGAGDGLALGFLAGYYLEEKSLQKSVLQGQLVARHYCTQKATTDHLITRTELEKLMNRLEGK